jgi:hypothetical protein
MAKTEGMCIDEGKTWEPNIFLKRTEQNNIGYVLHVVLSQTSGIYTTSKLLRLLSGIRKMMFHTAFFSLSPSFQEMRYPNLAIFERRICSESAPPIWSSSRCWSKEASPAVENRVPLVTWRFGNRRQPKHRDQKEIISNGSDLISIYRIYRYLPVIFDVSHAFQA